MGKRTGWISNAAKVTGISVAAIRYYERMGLLENISRTDAGYRIMGHEAIARLRIIITAKSFGFNLRDIRKIFSRAEGRAGKADQCKLLRETISTGLKRVEEAEKLVAEMKKQMYLLTMQCPGCNQHDSNPCRVIESIQVQAMQTPSFIPRVDLAIRSK